MCLSLGGVLRCLTSWCEAQWTPVFARAWNCGSAAWQVPLKKSSTVAIWRTPDSFSKIEIEPTRIHDLTDAQALLSSLGEQADEITQAATGKFLSAFVRAEKPHSDATP